MTYVFKFLPANQQNFQKFNGNYSPKLDGRAEIKWNLTIIAVFLQFSGNIRLYFRISSVAAGPKERFWNISVFPINICVSY